MKKLAAIFLLIVYAGSVSGMAVHLHFCQRHLTTISFFYSGEKTGCGCSTKNKAKDCCRDSYVYQKTDTHNAGQLLYVAKSLAYSITLPVVEIRLHTATIQHNDPLDDPGFLLRRQGIHLYLLHRILLI